MLALLARAVLALCLATGLLAASGCGPAATTTSSTSSTGTSSTSRGAARGTAGSGATDPTSHLRWINESALPAEAHHTLAEIRSGGPYDYPRNDDVTYHNNNHALPSERDGYYHEYTVRTPGAGSRGARRIIRGQAGELYYTADHYQTFQRIREGQ